MPREPVPAEANLRDRMPLADTALKEQKRAPGGALEYCWDKVPLTYRNLEYR